MWLVAVSLEALAEDKQQEDEEESCHAVLPVPSSVSSSLLSSSEKTVAVALDFALQFFWTSVSVS